MRVLTIANYVDARGGLERSQLELSRGLVKKGHEVTLLYVHLGDLLGDWVSAGIKARRIPLTLPLRNAPLASGLKVATSLAAGAAARPDVVYVHRHLDVPLAVVLGSMIRRPVVCHLHLPPPEDVPGWLRRSLGRVERFIAVSHDTAGRWEEALGKPQAVVVAHNGVDTNRFRPPTAAERYAARGRLGVSHDTQVLLFLGRLRPEKGIEILLDAFTLLRSGGRRMELVVAGTAGGEENASYAEEIRERVQEAGGAAVAPRKDVRSLYWCADMVVVPSIWPEPQPLVVSEALATGIPVVASRVGGVPEILEGALEAGLVRPGDPVALADRIDQLLTDRHALEEMSVASLGAARARLSWDAAVDVVASSLGGSRRDSGRGGVP